MKASFYIKLFGAFLALIVILLFLITLSLNNFYLSYSEKKESVKIDTILETKIDKFSSYIKSYDNKLVFIESILSKQNNLVEIKYFIEKTIFEDTNILDFKIVGFDSKEFLKIKNLQNNENTNKNVRLESLFFEEYFKTLQSLSRYQIYHYCDTKTNQVLNFAIRGTNNFYIFKVDMKNILEDVTNSFSKKIFIKDTKGNFIDNFDLEILNDSEYISKKVYLEDNIYFTFFIKKSVIEDDFIKEYYKYILIATFILASILALIFTSIITKESNKIELENQKLNFDINKTDITLSENQKIMDSYIMFIQIDNDGIILKVSQAFCVFLGFSKSELIGNSYKIFFYKDIQKSFRKAINNQDIKENYKITNLKGKTKASEDFWVDLFIEEYILDDESRVYNIVCQDVTDKKRTYLLYKNLNMKIEEYDAIFENVHSGVALLTLDLKFVKVNNQMSELLGFSKKELLDMTPLDIVNKSSRNILKNILDDIKEFTNISKLEHIFIRKDGTAIHLELSLILMLKKQRIIFIINSLEDKRELQEVNANLESTIKSEIEKSKVKDEIHHKEQLKSAKLSYIGILSAGITHEINTPLTYIKGNLELMQYDIEDLPNCPEKQRMLNDSKKIKDGINRIANIVESMREISHSNEETRGDFNLYSTLNTALTMAHNRAKHISKIYLNGDLFSIDNINNDKFSFYSFIQKQRVEQIWIIIINNALDELIKIEDYEKRELKIDIFEEENFIVVKFKDNAEGLSQEIMKKLFEPFTSSKESGGMGIGLSIAKKIVEEHKGSINAYNENGAVFEVRLKKYKEEENI
ncbi:PAS domain-containing sensor histidine kinase [Arcobacter sp. FW59]|nr:PAS domain-containing sensor histidine kinase [Arcobacter sp. FW59]